LIGDHVRDLRKMNSSAVESRDLGIEITALEKANKTVKLLTVLEDTLL